MKTLKKLPKNPVKALRYYHNIDGTHKRYSQFELAEKLGCSQSNISKMERDLLSPDIKVLRNICVQFDDYAAFDCIRYFGE